MSRVIKSQYSDSSTLIAPLLVSPEEYLAEMGGAEAAAADAVARAKQVIQIIIRTAQADAKDILDQAYADGYKAGVEQATKSADALLHRLEAQIADVAEERAAQVRAIEEQVLMLCTESAEKIIRHEIRTDPNVVTRTIRLCLRRVRDRDEVTVRVSPSEVAHTRAMRDELLSSAEGIRGINIVDDRRVSAGGCIVESPSGDLDARIETQIEQLRRKVMDTFANEFSKPA